MVTFSIGKSAVGADVVHLTIENACPAMKDSTAPVRVKKGALRNDRAPLAYSDEGWCYAAFFSGAFKEARMRTATARTAAPSRNG